MQAASRPEYSKAQLSIFIPANNDTELLVLQSSALSNRSRPFLGPAPNSTHRISICRTSNAFFLMLQTEGRKKQRAQLCSRKGGEKVSSSGDSLASSGNVAGNGTAADTHALDANGIELTVVDGLAAGSGKSGNVSSGDIHAEAEADNVCDPSPRDDSDVRSPIPSSEQCGQKAPSPVEPPFNTSPKLSPEASPPGENVPCSTTAAATHERSSPASPPPNPSPKSSPANMTASTTPSTQASPAVKRLSATPAPVTPDRAADRAAAGKRSSATPAAASPNRAADRAAAAGAIAALTSPANVRSSPKPAQLSPRPSNTTPTTRQSPAKSSVSNTATLSPRPSNKTTPTGQSSAPAKTPSPETTAAVTAAQPPVAATNAAMQGDLTAPHAVTATQSPAAATNTALQGKSTPPSETTAAAGTVSPSPATNAAIPIKSPRLSDPSQPMPSQKTAASDKTSPLNGGVAQRPGWQTSCRVPTPKPLFSGINPTCTQSPQSDTVDAISPAKPSSGSRARLASTLSHGSTDPMAGPTPSAFEPSRVTKQARSDWKDSDVLTRSAALRTFLPGTSGSVASDGGASKKGKKKTHKPKYKKTHNGTRRVQAH
eukprot:gene73-12893_t